MTLRNAITRFRQVGDLWAPMTQGRRASLHDALDRLARRK